MKHVPPIIFDIDDGIQNERPQKSEKNMGVNAVFQML